jgi:uncharacterized protein YbjT (DUF2867 family)
VERAFLVTPSSDRVEMQQLAFVDAAKQNGVKQIVYRSQFNTKADSPVRFLHYHAAIEAAIQSSDMAYTFLRPNLFMQGVLNFRSTIASENAFYAAAGDAQVSAVDVRDIAEVAAVALTQTGHEGKIYNLTGSQALTHAQMAEYVSAALDRQIAFVEQGMSLKAAQAQVSMFDVNGLLETTRTDLEDFQKPYAHVHAPTRDFVAAIKSIKPTTIIGVSTVGGAFTQQVVEAMSKLNNRPVILALSNPTEHAECTAEQAYTWSKGKAIYTAGVQFPPVQLNGQTFVPRQANNFYIFPAVGLAIYATRAQRVSDEMFIEAASAVADQVPEDMLKQDLLYPLQSNILETEIKTAIRVTRLVFDSELARVDRPDDLEAVIRSQVYKPEY